MGAGSALETSPDGQGQLGKAWLGGTSPGGRIWPLRDFGGGVPRLGVESELQLPVYATATATWDLSHVCNLCHRSWQRWIPNSLSEGRDRTCVLMDTSWVLYL